MALLFVRKNDFFLCSFKQEKKIFTFFFLSLFSPTYFWVPMLCPSVLTSSSDHSPSLEAIQHRLANKHTTTSAGPMMIFCCCLSFPKVPQGWNTKCDAYLFSLYCKSIGFFFFFLSLVFTFPIFSYHFDDMSKTNSGQPPPHSARVCCIK
jgi:hypothetical protein